MSFFFLLLLRGDVFECSALNLTSVRIVNQEKVIQKYVCIGLERYYVGSKSRREIRRVRIGFLSYGFPLAFYGVFWEIFL